MNKTNHLASKLLLFFIVTILSNATSKKAQLSKNSPKSKSPTTRQKKSPLGFSLSRSSPSERDGSRQIKDVFGKVAVFSSSKINESQASNFQTSLKTISSLLYEFDQQNDIDHKKRTSEVLGRVKNEKIENRKMILFKKAVENIKKNANKMQKQGNENQNAIIKESHNSDVFHKNLDSKNTIKSSQITKKNEEKYQNTKQTQLNDKDAKKVINNTKKKTAVKTKVKFVTKQEK